MINVPNAIQAQVPPDIGVFLLSASRRKMSEKFVNLHARLESTVTQVRAIVFLHKLISLFCS